MAMQLVDGLDRVDVENDKVKWARRRGRRNKVKSFAALPGNFSADAHGKLHYLSEFAAWNFSYHI